MHITNTGVFSGFKTRGDMLHMTDYSNPGGNPTNIQHVDVDPSYIQLGCDGDSIRVDHPAVGNSFGYKTGGIDIKLVDGETIPYQRDEWDMVATYQYVFNTLELDNARELLDFITEHYGKLIDLIDHFGTHRSVILTTMPNEFTVHKRSRGTSVSLSFEEVQLTEII